MKATCATCGRQITVKKDGTLRHHIDQTRPKDAGWSVRCDGSDAYPAED